jgi:hypothetical protein
MVEQQQARRWGISTVAPGHPPCGPIPDGSIRHADATAAIDRTVRRHEK